MMMDKGDLAPALEIDCTSAVGVPDFSTATSVLVICRKEGDSVALFSRAPTSATSGGVVTYNWQVGDTDTPGRLLFQVEATWSGGKKQHFPAVGYLPVDIQDTLD